MPMASASLPIQSTNPGTPPLPKKQGRDPAVNNTAANPDGGGVLRIVPIYKHRGFHLVTISKLLADSGEIG